MGNGPGVMNLIRSRVGEDGNPVLRGNESRQGKSPPKHLRVSDLIRAMNGANWVIADLADLK